MLKEYYGLQSKNQEETERVFRKIVFMKIKNNERDIIHDIS